MASESSPPVTADAAASNGGAASPQRRRSLPSPWASVVRGDTEQQNSSPTVAAVPSAPGGSSSPPPEQVSAPSDETSSGVEAQPPESSVNGGGDSNGGRQRRPAWNRPVNGVVEPASVMGGNVSWPALSETTRPVLRSSSDTPRPISDGLVSSSQAPIIAQPPQRPANSNVHANSAVNNPTPTTRPRSRNRGGGGGGGSSSSGSGPSQNTFNQPSLPMPPPFPVLEVPYGMVPAIPPVLDNPVRGARPVGGGSQSHTGNDHSSQRNNSRRGNFGPRPRGDGPYHNNHGGRRDQDRRDSHHPPPPYIPPPLGYMPPPLPPGAGPFMGPPPVRVFPGQMGFEMGPPFIYVPAMTPEGFRTMPMVPPPPPPMLYSPVNENSLTNKILRQIEFYFSDDNLVKDNFLRSNMDDHGWVPIALIASFRRVELLTKDIPLILESLRSSTVIELQGDKLRRRNEWHKWLLSTGRPNSDAGSHASSSTPEHTLASSLQVVSLNDASTSENGNIIKGHKEIAAVELTEDQSGLANGDDNAAKEAPSSSV